MNYERMAILEWITRANEQKRTATSPCTNLALTSTNLYPNFSLKQEVEKAKPASTWKAIFELEEAELLEQMKEHPNPYDPIPDPKKRTALMYAVLTNKSSVVKHLLQDRNEAGLPKATKNYVNWEDCSGRTAFMLACSEKNISLEIIQCLIDNGVDPSLQSKKNKMTALMHAIVGKHHAVAGYLLRRDENGRTWPTRAYVNLENSQGLTAFMLACATKEIPLETLQCLLDHGASASHCNQKTKRTPLMYAVRTRRHELVNFLLGRDENGQSRLTRDCVNAQDNMGYTALMVACQDREAKLETIQCLLANGANPHLVARNEKNVIITASTLAQKINRQDILHCLREQALTQSSRPFGSFQQNSTFPPFSSYYSSSAAFQPNLVPPPSTPVQEIKGPWNSMANRGTGHSNLNGFLREEEAVEQAIQQSLLSSNPSDSRSHDTLTHTSFRINASSNRSNGNYSLTASDIRALKRVKDQLLGLVGSFFNPHSSSNANPSSNSIARYTAMLRSNPNMSSFPMEYPLSPASFTPLELSTSLLPESMSFNGPSALPNYPRPRRRRNIQRPMPSSIQSTEPADASTSLYPRHQFGQNYRSDPFSSPGMDVFHEIAHHMDRSMNLFRLFNNFWQLLHSSSLGNLNKEAMIEALKEILKPGGIFDYAHESLLEEYNRHCDASADTEDFQPNYGPGTFFLNKQHAMTMIAYSTVISCPDSKTKVRRSYKKTQITQLKENLDLLGTNASTSSSVDRNTVNGTSMSSNSTSNSILNSTANSTVSSSSSSCSSLSRNSSFSSASCSASSNAEPAFLHNTASSNPSSNVSHMSPIFLLQSQREEIFKISNLFFNGQQSRNIITVLEKTPLSPSDLIILLFHAIYFKADVYLVTYLLKQMKAEDLNKVGSLGHTPLTYACELQESLETINAVRCLLEHGADASVKNAKMQTAKEIALKHGSFKLTQLLSQYESTPITLSEEKPPEEDYLLDEANEGDEGDEASEAEESDEPENSSTAALPTLPSGGKRGWKDVQEVAESEEPESEPEEEKRTPTASIHSGAKRGRPMATEEITPRQNRPNLGLFSGFNSGFQATAGNASIASTPVFAPASSPRFFSALAAAPATNAAAAPNSVAVPAPSITESEWN